jgi:hypothetical protein
VHRLSRQPGPGVLYDTGATRIGASHSPSAPNASPCSGSGTATIRGSGGPSA